MEWIPALALAALVAALVVGAWEARRFDCDKRGPR
jgi:hypothetical protein